MSADHDRRIGNLVMIGVISALDEANALARVDVDGLITDWLHFAAARAGPGVREWSAPEVGEQVVVVSPYGDPSQGIIVCSVYQSAYAAPANVKTKHRTEFVDGAFIEYDRQAHGYTVDVPAGGAITLHIGQTTLKLQDGQATLTTPKLVVDSPDSSFTGKVTIAGDTTINGATAVKGIKSNGVNIGSDHKHSGVQPGSGVTGNPQ